VLDGRPTPFGNVFGYGFAQLELFIHLRKPGQSSVGGKATTIEGDLQR
jgi:hypothetical protein